MIWRKLLIDTVFINAEKAKLTNFSFNFVQIVFTEADRANNYHDQISPHYFKFEYNATDPYEREIGTQVLMDILLLAKCDQFLHTESSVASLASYFNPHMASHFLENEETEVCLNCLIVITYTFS